MKTSALLALLLSFSIGAVGCAASDADVDDDEDSTDATQTGELSAAAIDKGIVVNQSILGIKFQATREEVRAQLGKPTTAKNAKDPATGQPTKIYTYGATTFVFFQGEGGTWRVLNIDTHSPKLRTDKGSIGIGSSEADLKAAFPAAKCQTDEGWRWCNFGGQWFEKHMSFTMDKSGRISDVFFGAVAD
jgi:hypothetical protein